MSDLLSWTPPAPGKTDTSAEAGRAIGARAQTLRERAYVLICNHSLVAFYSGLTSDECAALMEEDILAIRPRFSELKDMGLIEDSGKRRVNRGGKRQIVWRRCTQ